MAEIRILLVDHHLRYRRGLRSILEMEKEMMPVGEVRNIQEIQNVLENTPIDVVVLDLATAGDKAAEAVSTIKSIRPETRVMVLAHEANGRLVEVLAAGADGVLLKDVGASGLVDGIRGLARVGAYLHPAVARVVLEVLRSVLAEGREDAACGEAVGWGGAQVPAAVAAPTPALAVHAPAGERRDASRGEAGWDWMVELESEEAGEDRAPGIVAPLTKREFEVLQLLAEGRSNRDIAKALVLSEKTVKNHVASILDKLVVRDRTQAVLVALRRGWVTLS
ncbi:response regulator transcription factor [Kyrpidia spormannii]|uniref:Uncharacterized protein n=2 Tax=Kyrpidia spormannii TaxID=2055160 RepID=A0ACA8ZDJ8_9BACL|nr:response regulator transcription factor [Kyrpidia spormannii]CAB3395179.1 conserved protein of unknown function [Kyrpidia spormannii]CAB3396018.1 conserved protein of unknown function [Kyrpidia spormannii]